MAFKLESRPTGETSVKIIKMRYIATSKGGVEMPLSILWIYRSYNAPITYISVRGQKKTCFLLLKNCPEPREFDMKFVPAPELLTDKSYPAPGHLTHIFIPAPGHLIRNFVPTPGMPGRGM